MSIIPVKIEPNNAYLGDCIELMKLMPDSSVDMLLTDIPYGEVNLNVMTGLRKNGKGDADILNFNLDEFLNQVLRITKGSFYIFCGIEQLSEIRKFFRLKKLTNRSCVWVKPNPSPVGGKHMWLSGLEHCIYAKKPGATFNEHCKRNVWEFTRGSSKKHPTQKSEKLFKYLINASSNEGDVIFDPCSGAGTTAIAAKALNRKYIAFEINKDYYNLIIDGLKDV